MKVSSLCFTTNPNYFHPRADWRFTLFLRNEIKSSGEAFCFSVPAASLYRRASWSDLLFVKCTLLYSNYASVCVWVIAPDTCQPKGRMVLGVSIVTPRSTGEGSLIGNLWHHVSFDFTFIACALLLLSLLFPLSLVNRIKTEVLHEGGSEINWIRHKAGEIGVWQRSSIIIGATTCGEAGGGALAREKPCS